MRRWFSVALLVLLGGCGLTNRVAIFDDRRMIASNQRFSLIESRTDIVRRDSLAPDIITHGLPVRIVRSDSTQSWGSLRGQLSLQPISGERRLTRNRTPAVLFAIPAAHLDVRPSASTIAVAEQLKGDFARRDTAATLELNLRELEARALAAADTMPGETRDFLLVCVEGDASPRHCWYPGERYLLKLAPIGQDTIAFPVFIERRNWMSSLTVGLVAIAVLLVVTTS